MLILRLLTLAFISLGFLAGLCQVRRQNYKFKVIIYIVGRGRVQAAFRFRKNLKVLVPMTTDISILSDISLQRVRL
jgi:flagellar biosynthesis regulator FlbT